MKCGVTLFTVESRGEQNMAEGGGGEVPGQLPASCAKAPFVHPYTGVIMWQMLLHRKNTKPVLL